MFIARAMSAPMAVARARVTSSLWLLASSLALPATVKSFSARSGRNRYIRIIIVLFNFIGSPHKHYMISYPVVSHIPLHIFKVSML